MSANGQSCSTSSGLCSGFEVIGHINIPDFTPVAISTSGNRAFVSGFDKMALLDISDMSNISVVSVSPIPQPQPRESLDAVGVGGYWYATMGGYIVLVYEMNDNLTEVGGWDVPYGWSLEVVVRDQHLFIAGHNASGVVLSIGDPTSPTQTGTSMPTGGFGDGLGPRAVAVEGDMAAFGYIDKRKQVTFFDVSDEHNSVEIATYEQPEGVRGVALNGNYAYLASLAAGLEVLDISTPETPVKAGQLSFSGTVAQAVARYSSTRLLLANEDGKLHYVDVTDAAAPKSLFTFQLSSNGIQEASKVKVEGDPITIGDRAAGDIYFLRPVERS
jgi:hypothetical protein